MQIYTRFYFKEPAAWRFIIICSFIFTFCFYINKLLTQLTEQWLSKPHTTESAKSFYADKTISAAKAALVVLAGAEGLEPLARGFGVDVEHHASI